MTIRTIGFMTLSLALATLAAAAEPPAEAPAAEQYAEYAEYAEFAEREQELAELAQELERNSIELIELRDELGPELVERVNHAFRIEKRPVLGINIGVDSDAAEAGPVDGVAVLGVTPGSAAANAGIRTGDRIVVFDGGSLAADSAEEARRRLLDALAETEAGAGVDVVVVRDGERLTVAATPREAYVHRVPLPPRAPVAPRVYSFAQGVTPGVDFLLSGAQRQWDGMELVELTPELGRYFGTDEGLLVVRKPATGDLPLQEGDVIRAIGDREPSSVSQAMRILRSYDAGDTLELEVMRDKKRRRLDVTVADRSAAAY
ncbi:MAG: PDZ domain-containing protein [Pseudomonadota bacterium]